MRGFGENMCVLKLIVQRARGRALGKEDAVGWQPGCEDINWDGLDFPKGKFRKLQRLNRAAWRELIGRETLFLDFHDHLSQRNSSTNANSLICRL
jgi:phosphoenolpyruvate carboxykinase (GTP)